MKKTHTLLKNATVAASSKSSKRGVLIGIRREDPTRIWERRAPLTPDAVYELKRGDENVDVEVQSCSRRVFVDGEYERAGARVVSQLTTPDLVLGVKEPPLHELDSIIANRTGSREVHAGSTAQTHLMFSHTIKGQKYNMPLLGRFLEPSLSAAGQPSGLRGSLKPRLIDYELLKEDGKRSVGFGWFAGAAGVLEAFSAMAQYHLERGIASPFLYASRPYTHRSLDEFKRTLRSIGGMITDKDKGVPEALGPFIVGVSGTGKVSQGALDMLKELPITWVRPDQLAGLVASKDYDRHTIYLVHAKSEDYLVRKDGGRYERVDYYANPEMYESVFHDRIAPYLTLFINGAGWAPGFPRLMSNLQLEKTLEKARRLGGGFRFENVADVSCDVEGGLEFLSKATTLSAPFYDIKPSTTSSTQQSVRMMSVDILPASMPLDASKHFSKALVPYLADLIEEYQVGDGNAYRGRYTQALEDSTIAQGGRLRGQWEGLLWEGVRDFAGAPFTGIQANAKEANVFSGKADKPAQKLERAFERAKTSGGGEKKRVLLLGSGMVAQPAVDYLACKLGVKLVIASNSAFELDNLIRPYKQSGNVEAVQMEFDDPRKYEHLVRDADVVISLLPAFMHVDVAKVCIRAGKHLVTASYMSPEMQALNKRAQSANTLVLTEIGLDPGIDHLSAMRMIDDLVHQKRKRLLSFISMCGGLPAPEDAIGVPLSYKFSWRPEGVLNAALEGAQWLLWRDYHEIPGRDLLKNYWSGLPITRDFELEGLPNRNSLTYSELYKLNHMRTFVRGTLRYPGYSSLMSSFVSMGLLNNRSKILLEGWHTLVRQAMVVQYEEGVRKSGVLPSLPSLLAASAKGNGVGLTKEREQERFEQLRDALEWLGLTLPGMQPVNAKEMPALPKGPQTPLSIFAYLLAEKLRYTSGERDMVVLSHEIVAEDKKQPLEEEVHTSTLITYATDRMHVGFEGERPASAMARTVGLPAAVAAGLIAYGRLGGMTGVQRPVNKDVYVPVLKELQEMGLEMDERVRNVEKGGRLGTVEECLGRNVRGVEGLERRPKEERDLDADKGWVEEEHVQWGKRRRM